MPFCAESPTRFRCSLARLGLAAVLVGTLLAPVATAGRPKGLKHKAPPFFVTKHRIRIGAELSQTKQGVREARVYFRSDKGDSNTFVRMAKQEETTHYQGILPAPGEDAAYVEYAIVVVAENGDASRTKFRKMKGYNIGFAPTWQSKIAGGQLKVYTELEQAPASIPGFKDDVDFQAVPEEQRYAVASGLAKGKRLKKASKKGAEEPGKEAAKAKATMKIAHKTPKYFVAGNRIMIEADIADRKYGIKETRVYFRAATEADFVFVTMIVGPRYHAVLPAPSENTEAIDYRILALNNNNVVYTSKAYVIKRKEDGKDGPKGLPKWQLEPTAEEIQVFSELPALPTQVAGFADSIAIDAAASTARFGVVTGITPLATSENVVGGVIVDAAAAEDIVGGAIAGGMASGGGLSATTVGIAALLAGGGGAAIGSAGGGGGGGGGVTSAANVQTFTSHSVPADPVPGQDVTVYVNTNAGAGTTVDYSVVGTDSYTDSGSLVTDDSGQISFGIPGAVAGVRDTVTVSVPGSGTGSKTFTYEF